MTKIFFPQHRLSKLLRQPGGKAVVEAVRDAEAALAKLSDNCLEFVDAALARIEAGFAAIEQPVGPAEALADLYDAANGLIGVAATARLIALDRTAFSLCDLTDRMAISGVLDLEALRVHIDALRLFRDHEGADDAFDARHVLLGLRRVRDKYAERLGAKAAAQ